MECFWPQADPAASKRNLQAAVHALRCSLRGCGPNGNDETVLFHHHCYLLNPALSIVQDVDHFRVACQRGKHAAGAGSTRKAIQAFEEVRILYTGDFLADSCEEWASGHRLALQDMRLSLLSQLGSLYSQGKEWEAAISCYHEILAIDGYREDIYRQLMRCYAACGRMADIKRVYRICQKRLRCDLRLAPAAETTVLYQQLAQEHVRLDQN
jgi:DNA-binding SARP family transcriptional activator